MSTEPSAIAEIVATHAAIPQSSNMTNVPDAAASAVAAIEPEESTQTSSIPQSAHDAVTQPARLPPEASFGMPADILPVVTTPLPPPPDRAKSLSTAPAMDAVDDAWDIGDEDPTATKEESTPSSNEMAGDGSVEGDGLDQVD